jgi:hypothetical protein
VSKILLVIFILYQNGIAGGRAITAPSMNDCRAAQPMIERQYRDALAAPGWSVAGVKSVCIEFT